MSPMTSRHPFIVVVLALAACAHTGAAPQAAAPSAGGAGDQVALGKQLYGDHCAKCHGDSGEGGEKAPPVVGPNALPLDPRPGARIRTGQFHTALDVGLFVKDNMPPKKAGSLTLDQYFAILAFDLSANGVDLKGQKVDADSAKQIVLHP